MADTSFFEEVEQDLRQDRYQALFKKYAPIGAAVIVLVVAVVGVREYMAWSSTRAGEAAGERFVSALSAIDENPSADAIAQLESFAADAPAGYAALGRHAYASALAETGQTELAADVFAAQADAANDQLIADMAALKAAYLREETASRQDLEQLLGPLVRSESPMRLAAREVLGATALKTGDLDAAELDFNAIVEADFAPPAMRARAREGLGVVASQRQRSGQTPAAEPAIAPDTATPSPE